MTPEKIDNSDLVHGLTSVDMRIDKDKEQKDNNPNKNKRKKVKIKSIDEIIEEELESEDFEDGHIDYHA